MAPSARVCHAGLELTEQDRKAGEWLSEHPHPLSALTSGCWGHSSFPGGRKVTEKARTWARLAYSPRGGWRELGVLWGLMLTRGWMQEWGQ